VEAALTAQNLPTPAHFESVDMPVPFALFLASHVPMPPSWQRALASWQRELCARLAAIPQQFPLPHLYLTLLTHFLSMLGNPPPRYHPNAYRRFIFVEKTKSSKATPLGVVDPLNIIDDLIETLATIWKHKSHLRLESLVEFKLNVKGILRARDGTLNGWITLFAYCGGDTGASGKCGYGPLVNGKHPNCEKCGYLICPECDSCRQNCSECQVRLSKSRYIPEEPPMFSEFMAHTARHDLVDKHIM
jgi:hypothetical protein